MGFSRLSHLKCATANVLNFHSTAFVWAIRAHWTRHTLISSKVRVLLLSHSVSEINHWFINAGPRLWLFVHLWEKLHLFRSDFHVWPPTSGCMRADARPLDSSDFRTQLTSRFQYIHKDYPCLEHTVLQAPAAQNITHLTQNMNLSGRGPRDLLKNGPILSHPWFQSVEREPLLPLHSSISSKGCGMRWENELSS